MADGASCQSPIANRSSSIAGASLNGGSGPLGADKYFLITFLPSEKLAGGTLRISSRICERANRRSGASKAGGESLHLIAMMSDKLWPLGRH